MPPALVGHYDDGGGGTGPGSAQYVTGVDDGLEVGGVAAPVGVCLLGLAAKRAFDVGLAGADRHLEEGSSLGDVHRFDMVATDGSWSWGWRWRDPRGGYWRSMLLSLVHAPGRARCSAPRSGARTVWMGLGRRISWGLSGARGRQRSGGRGEA